MMLAEPVSLPSSVFGSLFTLDSDDEGLDSDYAASSSSAELLMAELPFGAEQERISSISPPTMTTVDFSQPMPDTQLLLAELHSSQASVAPHTDDSMAQPLNDMQPTRSFWNSSVPMTTDPRGPQNFSRTFSGSQSIAMDLRSMSTSTTSAGSVSSTPLPSMLYQLDDEAFMRRCKELLDSTTPRQQRAAAQIFQPDFAAAVRAESRLTHHPRAAAASAMLALGHVARSEITMDASAAVPVKVEGRRSRRRRRGSSASEYVPTESTVSDEEDFVPRPAKRKRTTRRRYRPATKGKSDFLDLLKSLLKEGHECVQHFPVEGQPDSFYISNPAKLAALWAKKRPMSKSKKNTDVNTCHALLCYYSRRGRINCSKHLVGARSKNIYSFLEDEDDLATATATPSSDLPAEQKESEPQPETTLETED